MAEGWGGGVAVHACVTVCMCAILYIAEMTWYPCAEVFVERAAAAGDGVCE